ncbi:MAG TPA: hypothetical protein DCS93_36920 [Microscillaceae bacterium]|nr:hypothetical protein [Microscillaceae bacterium]
MKHLLAILLSFILSLASTVAQNESSKVKVQANWYKGDQLLYEVTKIDLEWYQGSLVTKDTLKYLASFNVIDSTKNFYKIEWKFGNTLMDNYELTKEQEVVLSQYDDIQVIYITNKQGKFIEITNWKDIAKMMDAMFTDLIKVTIKDLKGEEKERGKKQLSIMKQVYTSKMGIERQLLNEIFYLHMHFGNNYKTNEKNYYEATTSGIAGINYPIRYYQEISVFPDYLSEGIYQLQNKSKADEEDARKFIKVLLQQLGDGDKAIELEQGDSQLDIKSLEKYRYSIAEGILLKLEVEKALLLQVKNEGQKVLKKVKVELLKHKD